jgi:hypothetical protein
MSYPVYGDILKSVADVFKKDFLAAGGNAFELEVSNPTYSDVTLTSNTTLKKFTVSEKEKEQLTSSLSAKWAHSSGFTFDKIKFSGLGSPIVVENSLSGVVPDTKLEFQGDDSSKADLLATYKIKPVTVKGKFDLLNQKSFEVGAVGGSGAVTAGAIVTWTAGEGDKKPASTDLGVTVAYKTGPVFAGVIATKLFKNFEVLASYAVNKDISVASQVKADKKDSSYAVKFTGAATYQCNPKTLLKAKLTSDGVLGLSVKQSLDKKLVVSAWAETAVPLKGAPGIGVKAVIG